jgi:hypothetical protein
MEPIMTEPMSVEIMSQQELRAEVTRLREQVAKLEKLALDLEARADGHEAQSDMFRGERDKAEAQLQAANLVVGAADNVVLSATRDPEWVGMLHIRQDWITLLSDYIKAYRATQGGEVSNGTD